MCVREYQQIVRQKAQAQYIAASAAHALQQQQQQQQQSLSTKGNKLSTEDIGMQLARKCSQYIVDITQKEAR